MTTKRQGFRVLIADDESILSETLCRFLDSNGLYTHHVSDGTQARKIIRKWKPDVVLCDLMLPNLNAMQLLTELQAEGDLGPDKIRFIVFSGHNNQKNVQEAMRLGATDFLVKPLKHEEILSRLVLLLQPQRTVPEMPLEAPSLLSLDEKTDPKALYFLHLTDLTLREALRGGPCRDVLYNLASMLDLAMMAVRVSFIACDLGRRKGRVIASSDQPGLKTIEISLNKYPEILYVMRHNRLLALDNLDSDPTMHLIAQQHKQIQFNSLIVCPIMVEETLWGVFSVRLPAEKQSLTDAEIRYAQLVAHIGGLLLKSEPSLMQLAVSAG